MEISPWLNVSLSAGHGILPLTYQTLEMGLNRHPRTTFLLVLEDMTETLRLTASGMSDDTVGDPNERRTLRLVSAGLRDSLRSSSLFSDLFVSFTAHTRSANNCKDQKHRAREPRVGTETAGLVDGDEQPTTHKKASQYRKHSHPVEKDKWNVVCPQ